MIKKYQGSRNSCKMFPERFLQLQVQSMVNGMADTATGAGCQSGELENANGCFSWLNEIEQAQTSKPEKRLQEIEDALDVAMHH